MDAVKKKIVVVGAGAAGMMAAGRAAELGAKVVLIEKNQRVGRKIMITGKGRCNLTNNCEVRTFIENVPVNPRFLYSAINYFTPQDAMEFFESLGVELKTERGNRVFPVSDRAADIVDALREYVLSSGVKIVNDAARELLLEDGAVAGIKGEKETYYADSVIVCCGGKSYPLTGSTGDGYRLAAQAGHSVTELKPSLVPLESSDGDCKSMQGLSLKNIAVKIIDNKTGKTVYTDFGEMLFTHFGVSGPVILSASSHIRDISEGKYTLSVDLKPALDFEKLDRRIQNDFRENSNRDVDRKCNSITRAERHALCELLKGFTIDIKGFRPIEEAIVTSGGVKTTELSPKTMESKLVSGLYFAGEVIDCDAYTGGFNLQIAWSTGRLAGENAAYL